LKTRSAAADMPVAALAVVVAAVVVAKPGRYSQPGLLMSMHPLAEDAPASGGQATDAMQPRMQRQRRMTMMMMMMMMMMMTMKKKEEPLVGREAGGDAVLVGDVAAQDELLLLLLRTMKAEKRAQTVHPQSWQQKLMRAQMPVQRFRSAT
jgi:hypothetical protein